MSANNCIRNPVEEEKQRLRSLLFDCEVSEDILEALETILENTAWMKMKLDEAREAIMDSTVAIPYDNGGGQRGLRENPLFKGYSSLWKSYMSGMDRIMSVMPEPAEREKAPAAEAPKTVLEIVRGKRKGA